MISLTNLYNRLKDLQLKWNPTPKTQSTLSTLSTLTTLTNSFINHFYLCMTTLIISITSYKTIVPYQTKTKSFPAFQSTLNQGEGYEARLFPRNLIKPQPDPSIVKYSNQDQHDLFKKLTKMLFAVHCLLLLSSSTFPTQLIRVIFFPNWYKKNALACNEFEWK